MMQHLRLMYGIIIIISEVCSIVHVDIKLLEFRNESKSSERGQPCDNPAVSLFEGVDCDPVFYLCVCPSTRTSFTMSTAVCPYFQGRTQQYKDQNSPVFSTVLNTYMSNPLNATMPQWTGSVQFYMTVYDIDLLNKDDLIDTVVYDILTGPTNYNDRQWSDEQRIYGQRNNRGISKPTSLILQYRVYCDKESHVNSTNRCVPGAPVTGSPDPGSSGPGSPDQGSPDHDSPDASIPDHDSPALISPRPGSSGPGSSDPGSPDPDSPVSGSPDPGSPDRGSPDVGTPDHGSSDPGSLDPLDTDSPDPGSPVSNSPTPDSTYAGSQKDASAPTVVTSQTAASRQSYAESQLQSEKSSSGDKSSHMPTIVVVMSAILVVVLTVCIVIIILVVRLCRKKPDDRLITSDDNTQESVDDNYEDIDVSRMCDSRYDEYMHDRANAPLLPERPQYWNRAMQQPPERPECRNRAVQQLPERPRSQDNNSESTNRVAQEPMNDAHVARHSETNNSTGRGGRSGAQTPTRPVENPLGADNLSSAAYPVCGEATETSVGSEAMHSSSLIPEQPECVQPSSLSQQASYQLRSPVHQTNSYVSRPSVEMFEPRLIGTSLGKNDSLETGEHNDPENESGLDSFTGLEGPISHEIKSSSLTTDAPANNKDRCVTDGSADDMGTFSSDEASATDWKCQIREIKDINDYEEN